MFKNCNKTIFPQGKVRKIGIWLSLLGFVLLCMIAWQSFWFYKLYISTFMSHRVDSLAEFYEQNSLSYVMTNYVLWVFITLFIIFSLLRTTIFFFVRDKSFLTWFAPTVLGAFSATVLKIFFIHVILDNPSNFSQASIVIGLIQAIIPVLWIPYVRSSRYVREIFIH